MFAPPAGDGRQSVKPCQGAERPIPTLTRKGRTVTKVKLSTATRIEQIARKMSGVCDSIHAETSLSAPVESGGLDLDSLDLIQLALEIEKEFGIELPDEDVDKPSLGTFGGLVAYVEGKLMAQEAKARAEGYGIMSLPPGAVVEPGFHVSRA